MGDGNMLQVVVVAAVVGVAAAAVLVVFKRRQRREELEEWRQARDEMPLPQGETEVPEPTAS